MLGLQPPPSQTPSPSQSLCVSPPCRPPYSSCRTPQSKRELLGVRYAVQGVDGCESMDELAPPEYPQGLNLQELAHPVSPQVAPLDELAPLDKQLPPENPQGAPLNNLAPPGHPQVCSIVGPTPCNSVHIGLRYTHILPHCSCSCRCAVLLASCLVDHVNLTPNMGYIWALKSCRRQMEPASISPTLYSSFTPSLMSAPCFGPQPAATVNRSPTMMQGAC